MVDVLTQAQRSHNMSMVRAKGTEPETLLREILIANGAVAFNTHSPEIPGKPDFYFSEQRVAIFMDGCFWHGCTKCFKAPTTNMKFWRIKIAENTTRDRTVNKKLRARGIQILRIKEHEIKKNPDGVQKKIATTLTPKQPPVVLDLFAGAGGFSEGFISAGCELITHVEMNGDACNTIRTRMIYHALRKIRKLNDYKKYLLEKTTLKELVEKHDLQKEVDSVIQTRIGRKSYPTLINQIRHRLGNRALDIIIGGPPCQAYSHIGRSSDRNRMKRDERNYLYKYYVEFLKAFKPKIFVFENVPGLISAGNGIYLRKMRKLMQQAGYSTDYKVLNAADFGIPQERKRVILVGWSNRSRMTSYPNFKSIERSYRAKDFLTDLPHLKANTGNTVQSHQNNSALMRELGITNPNINLLLDHIARPQSKQDLKIYRIAVREKKKGINLKYSTLPKHLKTHKNQTSFTDRFKVVNLLGKATHTIIAHIAKDGHYYIHPDIKQNRSITVREAARLQTFPDDFKFEGSRTSQFQQTGNAVPPLLSKIIARELLHYL